MAEFGVYAKYITKIDSIPDADLIEVATVGGYTCVVGKGTYNVGDCVLYVPEDAVLPPNLIISLGLEGRLAGAQKNRIKAIKLRGVLSQGVLIRGEDVVYPQPQEDVDYAEFLNIKKYVAPIPVHFSGQAVNARGQLQPWIEIDAIKNMRSFDPLEGVWHDPFEGLYVYVTLKIHGTAFCCTLNKDGSFFVSSKGLGRKGIALVESDENVYWKAVHKYEIKERMEKAIQNFDQLSLYGEVYGPGVQDLTYGATELSFAAFDLRTNDKFLYPRIVQEICGIMEIPFVPLVYADMYDYDALVDLAEILSPDIGGLVSKVHEGLVVRAGSDVVGDRLIGKIQLMIPGAGWIARKVIDKYGYTQATMGDGSAPVYEPCCENHIGHKPDVKEAGNFGWCDGCQDWAPLESGKIADHDPSPPQYYGCPMCQLPYEYPSYTNPPCNDCAAASATGEEGYDDDGWEYDPNSEDNI
jgi:RNA ligase (TIGR02306 family)